MKISQEFRAAGVGFSPYNLRHAYARRGYEQGFPPEFLPRSMGHSDDVHTKVYKAWLGEDSDFKIYTAVIAKTAKFSAALEG
jgi:integrase